MTVRLLCLDLVGTVIEGPGDALGRYVNHGDDVRLFPEAGELIRRAHAAGTMIAIVSNQGGLSTGHMTQEDMQWIIYELDKQLGGPEYIDQWLVCQHHPQAANPAARECWCRKPMAGMIWAAAEKAGLDIVPSQVLMVGDLDEDEEAARRAGVKFMWARDWRGTV